MMHHFVELDHWGGTITCEPVQSESPLLVPSSLLSGIVRFRIVTALSKEAAIFNPSSCSEWYYVGTKLTEKNIKFECPESAESLLAILQSTDQKAVLIRSECIMLIPKDAGIYTPDTK